MTSEFDWRALPISEWPSIDQRRWIEARTIDEDSLEERRRASRWRPSSAELFCRCYGIWLAWLRFNGKLDDDAQPEDRISPASITAYLRALRQRGCLPKTLYNHAASLRHMCEALAPQRDWCWMLPMVARLQVVGKSEKNHSNLPPIRDLFELGLALMDRAEQMQGSPKQRALAFRNGLAIAILAARPFMRRENLTHIRIGQHLLFEGAFYRLQFSANEMKGRRSRGGPLPHILTAAIRRYLSLHRPALLAGRADPNQAFFISGMCRPLQPHNLSDEIGKATFAAFGRRITAHEFRHAAGSSIAREAPAHVAIVPAILGHADYRTSETYYIFASEQAAFRALDKTMDLLSKDEETKH